MERLRSFQEYLYRNFYNELHAAIAPHIEERKSGLSYHKVQNPNHVELVDISIKFVDVKDMPKMRIDFDVVLEAEIAIYETHSRYDADDEIYKWYKVSCSGDLECDLKDFSISRVCEYSGRSISVKALTDSLVPIIRKDDLESVAQDFLERYYQEALYEPVYVNPLKLTERMGLNLVKRKINANNSVFGQVVFADCEAEYYDAKDDSTKTVATKARTVVVDPDVFYLRNLGAFNNTIVHECVHWDKHRKAFELERLFNEKASTIQCNVIGGVKEKAFASDFDFIEWQANALAPRIQMPFTQTKVKVTELMRTYQMKYPNAILVDIIEPIIDEMAIFFGVSRLAAKIRMIDIGYEEASGTFTYIDGRYVKPHTCKKGKIKKNQTFCVSEKDAIIESATNPLLWEKIQSGRYLYVDSHFCINHRRYITTDSNGKVCLTDYARQHIDECCFAFDLSVQRSANSYAKQYYTECVLYRDATSEIVFEARFSDGALNEDLDKQAKAINDYAKELSKIMQEMPGGFSGALKYLMKWRNKTVESLAGDCCIDPKTIQRMRNDEDYDGSIETVIAICIALQLPPVLSIAFIGRSSFSIGVGEKGMIYSFLLSSCYTKSIYECNELLLHVGQKPLTKEK